MANHSSILAWKIPWMEEPGRLQSMGSQRVGHDRATSLLTTTGVLDIRYTPQKCRVLYLGEASGSRGQKLYLILPSVPKRYLN